MNRNLFILSLSFVVIFATTHCGKKSGDKAAGRINDAKVIFAIGNVTVKTKDTWSPAKNQMKLTQGDEIKTGKKSQCNLVIGKDSFISVKETSHLVLEKILKEVSGIEDNQLALKVGKSVVNPKKLLKGDSFKIKTPTAIAAVRGTRFVVESKPGVKLRVAVVEGKVELKRRVPVLESVDKDIIEKSDALMALKEKVDEETVVVNANESAFIDNKMAEEENSVIEKAVTEQVKVIRKEIEKSKGEEKERKIDPEKKAPAEVAVQKMRPVIKQEKKVKKIFATLSLMKKDKNEVRQIKKQKKIEKKDVEEVEKLEKDILEAKAKKLVTVEKKEEITKLKIKSPFMGSALYINDRFIGYNKALLNPIPGEDIKVKIVAAGYRPFVTTVNLKKGEIKNVTAVMKKAATLTVVSPVRYGRIYLNDRYVGRGRVVLTPGVEKKFTVAVKAPGFKDYSTEVTLGVGEQKVLRTELIRKKKLDRLTWKHKMGKTVLVKPVVYGRYLIIATNDGTLLLVSRTGKRIWKADLKRRIESTPMTWKGKIYVATSNGDFYALNAGTGRIVWKKKIFGSLLFGSRPVVAGGNLYFATSFGRVYSFTTAGKERWHVDLENGIYSSVAFDKGMVYVGAEDHNIYAIRAKDGDISWKFKADSRMVSSAPTIHNSILYIGCYSGTFFAVDALKGQEKWKLKTGDSIFSTPLIKGRRVYVGSNDGKLYAIDTASGKVAWTYNTGSKVKSKVAVTGNLIIITSGRRVMALDRTGGKLQWAHTFKKEVKTSATVSGNDIFVGLDDGEIASVKNSLIQKFR